VRHRVRVKLGRIEELTLYRPYRPIDIAITHIAATVQLGGDCLQEGIPVAHRQWASGGKDRGELGVGKRDRPHSL